MRVTCLADTAQDTQVLIAVSDNGIGLNSNGGQRRGGLGTKLVESFAKQLGAHHKVASSDIGTTHDLVIPKVG